MPLPLVTEFRRFQRRLGTISGWIFASEQSADRPMDRHLFDNWFVVTRISLTKRSAPSTVRAIRQAESR